MRPELVAHIGNVLTKTAAVRTQLRKTAAFKNDLVAFMRAARQQHQEKRASVRQHIRSIAGR